jgi:hypothetical protein
MSRSPGEHLRQIVCKRAGILRHERNGDLVAHSLPGTSCARRQKRVVVAKGQRAEIRRRNRESCGRSGRVIHALGALDLDLVEAEQLHEMQLAGVDVRLEQVGHAGHVQRLGLLDVISSGFGVALHGASGAYDLAARAAA